MLFISFKNLIPAGIAERCDEVLLCSGVGKNKDLIGALQLYLDSGLWRKRHVRILGLAGHIEIVDEFCHNNPQVKDMISVMPQVDDRNVVQAYQKAAWVWCIPRRRVWKIDCRGTAVRLSRGRC